MGTEIVCRDGGFYSLIMNAVFINECIIDLGSIQCQLALRVYLAVLNIHVRI